MSGEIKVLKISPTTGSDVTMGDSGDKFTFASGSEIDLTGVTKTGFPATATNAPAFYAYRSANQTIAASNTLTKVECDTVGFDSDSKYDGTTNFRFTPGTAAKYYISCQIQMANSVADNISDCQIAIYKNGVLYKDSRIVGGGHSYYSPGEFVTMHLNFIMDLNATDYIELWGAQEEISASSKYFGVGQQATAFSAFKLIGI